MKKVIILIDGENFRFKVEDILTLNKLNINKIDFSRIELDKLINQVFNVFKDLEIVEKRYYSAKIHSVKETESKSKELISLQRRLKKNLENKGFEFVMAGNVRPQRIKVDGKEKIIFREKGVDVRIAVDMVVMALDKQVDTIILCSSDSDLQPAVKEVGSRKVEVIYLGFSQNPNKGLTYSTNQTVLFRNPEVIKFIPKREI